MFSNYRYPTSGIAEATGTNILEEVLRPGGTARQIKIHTVGENAEVLINGQAILGIPAPGGKEYFFRSVKHYLDGEVGGIESVVIKGAGVYFFAKMSA